jgi:hypothetical protein
MTNDVEQPNRDPGYYWVNWSGEPEPAMWDGTRWYFIGTGDDTPDRPIVLSEKQIMFTGQRVIGPEDETRGGSEVVEQPEVQTDD